MNDRFINPITVSFELLEQYKGLVRRNLRNAGLQASDVDEIMFSLDVDRGLFLSLNRKYQTGDTSIREFCAAHALSPHLSDALGWAEKRHLYIHQETAIRSILAGIATVVSTGTGSGKTETFLIPILDYCLKHPGPGVKALIIYPMNALANDQIRRIETAVTYLVQEVSGLSLTCGLFTGSTSEETRNAIRRQPPDILITNYVMLDWMLMRSSDGPIFEASRETLHFIVLDELHTYRGNKATHLKYLLARLKARLGRQPIQIGTSATLRSHDAVGADSERLNRYIRSVLDVTEYTFVAPCYEVEPVDAPENAVLPLPISGEHLGWAMEVDIDAGLRNLGCLLGQSYSTWDLGSESIEGSRLYQDLRHNAFVQAVRRSLSDNGAQSFTDLARLLHTLLPNTYPANAVEDLAKAYLSAIAFVNWQAETAGTPLLDFRAHLFVRQVGGHLKRCIKCRRYHSGSQEHCQDCGFPLFYVYQGDVRYCIGKVAGNRLHWDLRQSSDTHKKAFYVLITVDPNEEDSADGLTFQDALQLGRQEIVLKYDVYGQLRLQHLPVRDYAGVTADLIPLVDSRQPSEYLHCIVKSILDFEPPRRKQLLAFIDNRERAGRYAAALQDEFASRFLWEFLKLSYPEGRIMDPIDALELFHRCIPPNEELSPVEQGLFAEMDLWFWRSISTPPRLYVSGHDALVLNNPDRFDEFDLKLLDIFLAERAILKPELEEQAHSQYIRFRKYLAMDRMGIHFEDGHGSKHAGYGSISLAEQAQEYRDFVLAHGASRIRQGIQALAERGVVRQAVTPDDKTHYYLDPHELHLEVPTSAFRGYDQIKERFLLTSQVHSSEVKDQERIDREHAFKAGTLNCLVATPTLEMGIDIGQLQNVLMIGAPPVPSNYAQRAGRAGRGQKGNFALLVTFCQEDSDHDMYFFTRPKQMIDGVISPPTLNPTNLEIVKKHANAWALAGHVDSLATLRSFCTAFDGTSLTELNAIQPVFRSIPVAWDYLRNEFGGRLQREVAQITGYPLRTLYANGFLPDYSFRRDQVLLVEAEQAKLAAVSGESALAEFALSEREPELAYTALAPGEELFVAGDAYTVTPAGEYRKIEVSETEPVRSYIWLSAERQVRLARKHKEYRKYDRLLRFSNDQPYVDKRKVLGIAYHPLCRFVLLNRGFYDLSGLRRFEDERGSFSIGYELYREAVLLRFDSLVCHSETLYLSILSALERTISDRYQLDHGDIGLLIGVEPEPADPEDRPHVYVAIYDKSGNGNVPLRKVYDQFDEVVAESYHAMLACQGSAGNPCDNGCYLCLRSPGTRHFTASVDKKSALMFTGYLLGHGRFVPSIPPYQPPAVQSDLVLRLSQEGSRFTVIGPGGVYSADAGENQNSTVFDLLNRAAQAEYREGMQGLKLIAKGYWVDAINQGQVKKGREAFARLQFNLLRFQSVVAESPKL